MKWDVVPEGESVLQAHSAGVVVMNTEELSYARHGSAQRSFSYMIERHGVPGSVIMDRVVFPAVAPMLVPRPLGSATGSALLRLTSGSISMLRASGAIWTPERLQVASSVLIDGDATKESNRTLTARLDSTLDLPVIIVGELGLDPLDTVPRGLSGVAGALVREPMEALAREASMADWRPQQR
jgi:hypothetical protein